MKICARCEKPKSECEFGKDTHRKDGLNPYCKKCKHYEYLKNREARLAKCKEYVAANLEKTKKYQREYRKKNADKLKEYNSEYQEYNSDKIKKQRKRHYKDNRDKIIKKNTEWGKRNPDKRREIINNWIKVNKHRRRQITKTYFDKNREKILEWHKAKRDTIDDKYIMKLLIHNDGKTAEQIANSPILLDLKRAKIINKRVKKFINNKNKNNEKE